MFSKDLVSLVLFYGFITILVLVLLLVLLVFLFAPNNIYSEKINPYECGFKRFQTTNMAVHVHFYILGVLFLIFDMEILFLYPWVFVAHISGFVGFYIVFFFLIIILGGFIYEYKQKLISLDN